MFPKPQTYYELHVCELYIAALLLFIYKTRLNRFNISRKQNTQHNPTVATDQHETTASGVKDCEIIDIKAKFNHSMKQENMS